MVADEMPFWEKPLAELDKDEWEALCDGCGRCCLKKLHDERTETTHYTRVVCRLMDQQTCRCTAYTKRAKLVPDCLVLNLEMLSTLNWIPDTCAYRLRWEGKPLYPWHPLIAGSRKRMIDEGITVSGKVISEEYVHEAGMEEHIVKWVGPACSI